MRTALAVWLRIELPQLPLPAILIGTANITNKRRVHAHLITFSMPYGTLTVDQYLTIFNFNVVPRYFVFISLYTLAGSNVESPAVPRTGDHVDVVIILELPAVLGTPEFPERFPLAQRTALVRTEIGECMIFSIYFKHGNFNSLDFYNNTITVLRKVGLVHNFVSLATHCLSVNIEDVHSCFTHDSTDGFRIEVIVDPVEELVGRVEV